MGTNGKHHSDLSGEWERPAHKPHPYSEAADHERRDRADDLSAARGIFRWTLAAAALWILLSLFMCSGKAAAQGFHWTGREHNASGCLEIWESRGGSIAEAEALFASADCIRITGPCMSACTMALGHADVCWTDRASFHFHAGWTRNGWDQTASDAGSLQMFASYPAEVRRLLPPLTDWTEDFTVWPAEWTAAVMNKELC